jgi:hypothetical protein
VASLEMFASRQDGVQALELVGSTYVRIACILLDPYEIDRNRFNPYS